MKPTHRFLAVQAVPLTAAAKFAVVGAFDLVADNGFATLKTFSLLLSLVTPFMMAASLRARLLLLADSFVAEDIPPMKRLLWLASVVGVALSASVLVGTPYVAIGLLMSGTKITENILGAQVAEIQRAGLRDRAILVRLSRNALTLAAYLAIFVTDSLAWTLAAELVVGIVSVLLLERSLRAPATGPGRGYVALLRDSAAFSLAAFLNAAVASILLRRMIASGHVAGAEVVSVVASALNVSGRMLSENNLFYRKRVDELLFRLSTTLPSYAAVAVSVLAVATVGVMYASRSWSPQQGTLALLLVGIVAFALNAVSFAFRQSLLLIGRQNDVIGFHLLECGVVAMLTVGADPLWGVIVLFGSRALRMVGFGVIFAQVVGRRG